MNPQPRPTKTHKLTVRGQTVITRTPRRFVAVAVRPEPVLTDEGGVLVAFARVEKRTDSLATARTAARRYPRFRGGLVVVVDLDTGEEVAS